MKQGVIKLALSGSSSSHRCRLVRRLTILHREWCGRHSKPIRHGQGSACLQDVSHGVGVAADPRCELAIGPCPCTESQPSLSATTVCLR